MKINPRQMEKLMKQMGMQPTEIPAEEVVIRTAGGEILIRNPQVVRINMMGSETFQITGSVEERPGNHGNDDIRMVAEQTGATEADAKKALEASGGDLAQAIISLKKSKKA